MADLNADKGIVSEEAEIAAVNKAAAKEQTETPDKGNVVETLVPSPAAKSPTDKVVTADKPVFNAQSEFEKLQKNYSELQKHSTQTSQERADLKRQYQELQTQQKQILEMIQKATEAPFDPEKFQSEWKEKGPQALDGFIQKKIDSAVQAVKSGYDKTIGDMQGDNLHLRTALKVMGMQGNEEKFPNFDDLYPKMKEIAAAENCPVDLNKPIEEVLEELYAHAKSQSSEAAVQIAAVEAKKRAEADAAKESRTTVAAGGKKCTTPTPDLDKMPLEDLEKFVIAQHGIADEA
jgi:chromosome segregation ATPase